MTRNRKVDPEVLEREYIYDSGTPPISYTDLATKYGLARNTVAEKGIRGRWYERREEFRKTLGMKVTEALGEEWVRFETAAREKAMDIGLQVLTKFEEQLKDPEFKVSTRDMVAVASMMRTLGMDAAAARNNGEEALIDPDNAPLTEEFARRVLDATESGRLGPGPAAPPAGPEGTGESG